MQMKVTVIETTPSYTGMFAPTEFKDWLTSLLETAAKHLNREYLLTREIKLFMELMVLYISQINTS